MLYIQRTNWSQTRRDKATNPPRKTHFVAGLRGKVGEGQSVSRFIEVTAGRTSEAAAAVGKPRVVTLTLDL
jgi:hypothetical protein